MGLYLTMPEAVCKWLNDSTESDRFQWFSLNIVADGFPTAMQLEKRLIIPIHHVLQITFKMKVYSLGNHSKIVLHF